MKKYLTFLTLLLFTLTAVPLSASALSKDKKATTHKHQDNSSCCCCDMKSTKGDKKNDCGKMDSKTNDDKKDSPAK